MNQIFQINHLIKPIHILKYIHIIIICVLLILSINSQQPNQINTPIQNQKHNNQSINPINQIKNFSFTSKQQLQIIPQNQQIIQQPITTSEFLKYQRIYTSTQYYALFSSYLSQISLSQTINVTHLSNGKQLCIQSKLCQFYYYVIKPKFDPQDFSSFQINKNNNVKNIFIVAGMHGNQYLGPMSMLYSLKYLQTPGTRIILFPLANPSGFDHNRRLVYPTNLDPNRDFPIQQYTKCLQTSSSLIIDHIYRKYHIDLTLALHNGRSQIGWNWGTMREKDLSHTPDQDIYRDIGEWLKFVGGYNEKNHMEEFKIGTMNQVIYPVKGGFQDWAYAASWYNASAAITPTRSCPFQKFPYNMTNGLVFLFQLGPFQVNQKLFGSQQGLHIHPFSQKQSNGYLSRAIRMLSGLMKVPNPRIQFKFTNQNIIFKLNGCKKGIIQNLKIIQKQTNKSFFQSKQKIEIIGNINNQTIQPSVFKLQQKLLNDNNKKNILQNGRSLILHYSLACDSNWLGKGQTIFGKSRIFKVKQTLILSLKSTIFIPKSFYYSVSEALDDFSYIGGQQNEKKSTVSQLLQATTQLIIVFIILLVILLTVIIVIYAICRQIKKDLNQKKLKKLKKKLQQVNSQIDNSSISEDDISQSSVNDIKMTKKQSKNIIRKVVQSYPHMCESDKSIKTEQLEQVLQLQQFVKQYQNMINK